ncbi:hypothetical protein B0H14DRAFT_2726665 [Mycena olivaceomarginata]|nr:hypothetical protein B0H14DRAFT_2726665 [Mycena olivaceomarginata]
MSLSLIYVNLATLALGSLFYGIYSVLFSISIYLFIRRHNAEYTSPESRKNNSIYKSMVFLSAISLFAVVTTHWLITVYGAFIAFRSFPSCPDSEISVNENSQLVLDTAQDSVLSAAIILGDSLITHRLWVVWSHKKLILVIPLLSLATLTITSSFSTYTNVHNPDVFSNPYLKVNTGLILLYVFCLYRFHSGFFIQAIARTTIFCTAFISWRIWTVTRFSKLSEGNNLRALVVQTGPAVVGMVNALIHTRVGLGWTSDQMQELPAPSALRFAGRSADESREESTSVRMRDIL